MDLVGVIDASIESLPTGEHTQGLVAIRRHISAAIRHFEREDGGSLDSHTDAIYRCNQAFEGGLKEAYRVLADKDPQRLSPYEIEKYLEEKKVVRSRVLKQFTRYREDYRNPSTHDYKIDFDEDESLLAIVSVCAFTKLLLSQIAGKLAHNAGKSVISDGQLKQTSDLSPRVALTNILMRTLLLLPEKRIPASSESISQFIDGVLISQKYKTDLRVDEDYSFDDDDITWNNVVSISGKQIPIEIRIAPHCDFVKTIDWMSEKMKSEGKKDAILIVANKGPLPAFRNRFIDIDSDTRIQMIYSDDPPKFTSAKCKSLFSSMTK